MKMDSANNNQNTNVNNVPKSDPMSHDDKSTIYEILLGVVLIFAQYFLNNNFIGIGYSKFYFDVVLFGFLILIILSSIDKGFLKAVLLFSFFFFTSAAVLNHLNVFIRLASITSFGFLGQNFMVVFYYILMIILTAIFAISLNKEEGQKIINYAVLSAASILLPFVITNIPAVNYFLVQEGMSLVKLFFSIPFLWQPFFISGIFKAKEKGSNVAKVYSFLWLMIILLITFVASYAAVPAEDRANLQSVGLQTIDSSLNDLNTAINDTKNIIDKNILNPIKYGFDSSSQIESQVDSEQTTYDKGLEIGKVEFSESNSNSGAIIDFSSSVQKYTSWIELESVGGDYIDDFSVEIACKAKLKAYSGFFNDPDETEIELPGNILESDDAFLITNHKDLKNSRTITCDYDKTYFLNNINAERLSNIANAGYFSIEHKIAYSFFSAGYLTRFFINSDIYNELRSTVKGDTQEMYRQLNIQNAQKYQDSQYTSGPIKIGLEFNRDDVLIPVDSTSNRLSLNSEISTDLVETNTQIQDISLILVVPNQLSLDVSSCSPFEISPVDMTDLDEDMQKIEAVLGSIQDSKIYITTNIGILNHQNQKIRFSCPVNINDDFTNGLLKGSIGIYTVYEVDTTKKNSISIVYQNEN